MVLVKSNASASEEELQNHCRTKVAEFKVPKVVYIVDSVPKTATMKIQRRIVAAHFLNLSKTQ